MNTTHAPWLFTGCPTAFGAGALLAQRVRGDHVSQTFISFIVQLVRKQKTAMFRLAIKCRSLLDKLASGLSSVAAKAREAARAVTRAPSVRRCPSKRSVTTQTRLKGSQIWSVHNFIGAAPY